MRLKECFITQQIGDKQMMVAVDSKIFSGMVSSNKTAGEIVDLLKKETDKEEIVEAMLARYDAPRSVIEADVEKIIAQLESIGALEA